MSGTGDRLHLVRHSEVHNPEWVVYAGLPGFGLSLRGNEQAQAAAAWLARTPLSRVVSSPLERAVATASPIAKLHGLPVETFEELGEWGLSMRWAGHRWPDLAQTFPGELEAYQSDPSDLPFAPESLAVAGRRIATCAEQAWADRPVPGHVVVVSHQDPIEAARRILTGRDLFDFHANKPAHASVITLAPAPDAWREISVFTPWQE